MNINTFYDKLNGKLTRMESLQLVKLFLKTNDAYTLVPFSNNESNNSTAGIATDPIRALMERVTNSLDSFNEFYVECNPHSSGANSPKELVNEYMGYNLEKMPKKDRLPLAEKTVRLVRSIDESSKTPEHSFSIIDNAQGITPDEMLDTILTFHKSNKAGKAYTLGQYGQGGGASLSFTNGATIIMSRKQTYNKRTNSISSSDNIGFTAIIKQEADEDHPRSMYMMLVEKRTGLPIVVNVENVKDPIECGTKVTHIDYEHEGLKGSASKVSPYFAVRRVLADVELPVYLKDEAKIAVKSGTHTMYGSFKVLSNQATGADGCNADEQNKVEYVTDGYDGGFTDIPIEGDGGFISVRAFVTSPKDGRSTIGNYFTEGKTTIITINGQNQHEFDGKSKIFRDFKFLGGFMAVQIKADNLTPSQKDKLFASTREAARDVSLLAMIRKEVYNFLSDNDYLKILEEKRKKSSNMKTVENTTGLEVLKELGMLPGAGDIGKGTSKTGSKGKTKINPPKNPNNVDVTAARELTDDPQMLSFVNTGILNIIKGDKHRHVHIMTDATDEFDDRIEVTITGNHTNKGVVNFATKSKLSNGRFSIMLDSSKASTHDDGVIEIKFKGTKLSARCNFIVNPIQQKTNTTAVAGTGNNKILANTPEIECSPIDEASDGSLINILVKCHDDEKEHNTYDSAAYALFNVDENKITIFYSKDYPEYRHCYNKAGKRNADTFNEQYEKYLSIHALQSLDVEVNDVTTNWNTVTKTLAVFAYENCK